MCGSASAVSWDQEAGPGGRCVPCDGHQGQAGAAAAARPRVDPQLVFASSSQERFVATQLLQHHDQELKHHHGKVATRR